MHLDLNFKIQDLKDNDVTFDIGCEASEIVANLLLAQTKLPVALTAIKAKDMALTLFKKKAIRLTKEEFNALKEIITTSNLLVIAKAPIEEAFLVAESPVVEEVVIVE